LVILLAGGTKKRQDADIAAAKGHWRDYINATIGFKELSQVFDKSSKSLMRMFGPKGNPPGEQPVRGDLLYAGARGDTPGSQSSEGGLVVSGSAQSAIFSSILKDFLSMVFSWYYRLAGK
jgi:hypothetical protein